MLLPIALAALLVQPAADPGPALTAHRITAAQGAPTIDGVLDDPVWLVAGSVSDFVQMEPNPGEPARFRTEGRVAFDHEAVYVALRAFDPEPDRIMAQLTRRDQDSSSDWLMVAFDSRHDRRTAYLFGVNPVGVKRDMVFTNDVEEDDGWDAVWSVQARTDSLGWTAEFRIPLSALRFSTGGDGVWGFQVVRMVQRVKEQSSWTPMRQDEQRIVSRFGELHGMTGMPSPRRLELLPYTVTGLTRAPGEAANPFYSSTDWRSSVGLDLKYGLTSNITLDATINPDFGQVEADPSEVNLSAFETFLPEKRPFFTEGADIFRFGLSLGDGDNAVEQLFYSRRVGRAPQGGVDTRSGEYADRPGQTNILGAAKISGRTQAGWSFGALNAVTGEEHARIGSLGADFRTQVVEPLTNYSVLRVKRDLNQGDTQIGAVGTGVLRRLDGTGMDDLRSSAVAGGMDFSHRFSNDHWQVTGSLIGSSIHGSRESILAAQRSSARYFQRPDADYVEVDSTATSMGGWFSSYMLMKIGGSKLRYGVLGQVRSPGFETNDVGFQRSADEIFNVFWAGYREIEPTRVFRSYGFNINLWNGRNFGWDNLQTGGNLNFNGQLRNFWRFAVGTNFQREGLSTFALRGGPAIVTPPGQNAFLFVGSDDRKPLSAGVQAFGRRERESGDRRGGFSVNGEWRATSSTQLSLSPEYFLNRSAWQYVTQRTDAAGRTHYVFSEIDQKTVSVSTRLSHTFNPELSFQLYAQPFVSAGRYSGFREVRDPRAARFADRFRLFEPSSVTRAGERYLVRTGPDATGEIRFNDPDFNVRAVNLNAVLRWEYRPGSAVFFVWSHGRNGSGDQSDLRLRRDFTELLGEPSTNVFMIKANWWLSR